MVLQGTALPLNVIRNFGSIFRNFEKQKVEKCLVSVIEIHCLHDTASLLHLLDCKY